MNRFLCLLPLLLVASLNGCTSCQDNPYASTRKAPLSVPLGLMHEDQQIPSQDIVFFSRKPDGRVYVISKWMPSPHMMLIYVEKANGQFREQARDQDACIDIEDGDRRVIAFTIMDEERCDDHEEAFCERRLSRDVLELH